MNGDPQDPAPEAAPIDPGPLPRDPNDWEDYGAASGPAFPQFRFAPDGALLLFKEDGSFKEVRPAAPAPASAYEIEQLGRQADAALKAIQQFNATHEINLGTLDLRRDELAVAEASGRRSDVINLTGVIANITTSINNSMIELAQLRQNTENLNAQLAQQAQQAGADRTFQAAQNSATRALQLTQLTEQSRGQNLQQQIEIAGQIADFSRDPGDIVANIAAQQQFGSISTALAGGFSGLTEEGLAPLARFLETQDVARAEGGRLEQQQSLLADALQRALSPTLGLQQVAPVQVQQAQEPKLQNLDISTLADSATDLLDQAAPAEGPAPTAAPAAAPTTTPQGVFAPTRPRTTMMPGVPEEELIARGAFDFDDIAADVLQDLHLKGREIPQARGGGDPESRFVRRAQEEAAALRDSRASTGYPLPSTATTRLLRGSAADTAPAPEVLPARNVLQDLHLVGREIPQARGGGVFGESVEVHDGEVVTPIAGGGFVVTPLKEKPRKQAQDGGVFGVQPRPESVARARSLLAGAFQKAFERFRGAAPDIPVTQGVIAPVGVSAPGTDPALQQAAAGVTAAGAGVTRQAFARDLARSRPTGIRQGIFRRTR